MMFSILKTLKHLRFVTLVLLVVLLCSCPKDKISFSELCPYDLEFGLHVLKVPFKVNPHQFSYSVGDSIEIVSSFSNNIEDLSSKEIFEINNFPFKPIFILYRFDNSNDWHSGFNDNNVTVENKFSPDFYSSTRYANGFRIRFHFENGRYEFKMKMKLEKAGKYVLLISDVYQLHVGSGHGDLNSEANNLQFDGKCPGLPLSIANTIIGDDYLEKVLPQLLELNKNPYRTNLGSWNINHQKLDGGLVFESNGAFGFEVVE